MYHIKFRFPSTEQVVEQDYNADEKISSGDKILVENNKIIELADVLNIRNIESQEKEISNEQKDFTIIRKVSEEDEKKISDLKKIAKEFLPICNEKIEKYALDMKILDADLSFDGKKITIYFSADNRVDFRQLVGDLVKTFKKLIRLQQVGVRNEARRYGGYGLCGREICCAKILANPETVTLDMAKQQNILSSSGKISGLCGKLMCCLSYEKDIYAKVKKNMPAIGTELKCGKKKGVVVEQSVPKGTVTIKTPDNKYEKISLEELKK